MAAWLARGRSTLERHLYLVDPMGEWMMRFPPDPDPAKPAATSIASCARPRRGTSRVASGQGPDAVAPLYDLAPIARVAPPASCFAAGPLA